MFSSSTKSKQIQTNVCQSLLFLARVLSLYRANCQTISMYPVCFSRDFGNNIFFLLFFFGIFCFSIFFTFFCFLFVCVFLFETKKKYILIHTRLCRHLNDEEISSDTFPETWLLFLALFGIFFPNSFEGMFYTFLYVLATDKTFAAIFFLEF